MKLRYKILTGLVATMVLATASLALVMSHDSPCPTAAAPAAGTATQQAAVFRCYGAPDVVQIERIEQPPLADDQVRVKVRAASVNALDWHYLRGKPYIMRLSTGLGTPKNTRMGVDFAGVVESVGSKVTRFKVGDEVFGGRNGALAEYVDVAEDRNVVLKPDNISFEQAGSVAIAGVTALQALRDHGQLKAGQKVLINGASGGVGTFAVQIAKSMGAEVTGVCSSRNAAMVQSIGADHVIDYKQTDFTQGSERYDLIVDMVGNHSLSAIRRALTEQGRLVIVGGSSENNFLGPLTGAIWAMATAPFVSQEMGMMLAELSAEDLGTLSELMQAGKLSPVMDRGYPLAQTADAVRYLEQGHARGKVVVTID